MTKDAIFSKNPNTLAVSPAFAVASGLFLRRDLARTIPARAKGIANDVKNRLPIPNQKEKERNMLMSPKKRLKIPLIPEPPLILPPPAKNDFQINSPSVHIIRLMFFNPAFKLHFFIRSIVIHFLRFYSYSSFTPTFPPSDFDSYCLRVRESLRHSPVLTSNLLP